MIGIGATIVALVIFFLGAIVWAKTEVTGPDMFDMVTNGALVVAAFFAHRTWKKAEHWKVKKN